MEHIVLEQSYDSPLTEEAHARLGSRIGGCLEQYGAHWLTTFLSKDARRMICVFEAPDAEAVRAAYRSAGATFERVWRAQVFTRPDVPPAEG